MRPRSGVLLASSPQMSDPNFLRTVIYLLDHGKNGSLGFIINRALEIPLKELWQEVPLGLAEECLAAEGGPVDRHKGLLVHCDTSLPGAQLMAEGIAVGGDLIALTDRWQNGSDAVGPRLFLGHSGWSVGQLETEIEEGAWIVRPGRLDLLITPNPSDMLWQQVVEGHNGGTPEPSRN